MMPRDSDRSRWEERYTARADATPRAPSTFLADHLALLPRGRALDIASGDGRHAILLAEHGYRVDAIDFAATGLRLARSAALRAGLAIQVLQADLEFYPLPAQRYDVVLSFFFLQRSLWPALKRALRPGGSVVVETFLIDQRNLGHPRNPAFLLNYGELEEVFADFEIVFHQEGLLATGDGSAYLARIIARKPSSSQH